jgi:predicted transcriptional regulator
MVTVSFELDEQQSQKLKALSTAARRSEQDLCREALQQYLHAQEPAAHQTGPAGYAALRAMIGLVKEGPTQLSVEHDLRPGDTS